MPAMRSPSSDWISAVVDGLIGYKRLGYSFDDAWLAVLAKHPARSRDDYADMLFDERGVGTVTLSNRNTLVGFFREACRVAWHDEQPKLRYFTFDGLHADEDLSTPAVRNRAA